MSTTTLQGGPDSEPTLRQRAEEWMADNEPVMKLFEQFAQQMVSRRRRFGIGALTERVRWECAYLWTETVKINNSFRAYIARDLAKRMPSVAELIETRITRAADKPYREPHKDQRVDPLTDEPMDDGA